MRGGAMRRCVVRVVQLLVLVVVVVNIIWAPFTAHSCKRHGGVVPRASKDRDYLAESYVDQMARLNDAARLDQHSRYLIENANFCKTKNGSDADVFLLVLVRSRHTEQYERMTHRHINRDMNIARSPGGGAVKTLFLFGQDVVESKNTDLAKESSMFADIATANFVEHYQNLTLKLLFGLRWAADFCPQASFVMMLDVDVFVNYGPLVRDLRPFVRRPLYTGWVQNKSAVIRDENSRWYVSTDEYPGEYYLPYCMGGAYVLSQAAIRAALDVYRTVPLIPIEDVYMSMVLNKAGVAPTDNYRFLMPEKPPLDPCVYREISAAHQFTPKQLIHIWAEISSLGPDSCATGHPAIADILSFRLGKSNDFGDTTI